MAILDELGARLAAWDEAAGDPIGAGPLRSAYRRSLRDPRAARSGSSCPADELRRARPSTSTSTGGSSCSPADGWQPGRRRGRRRPPALTGGVACTGGAPPWNDAAHGLPAKLLADGERIEFEMRPHWRSLIVPAIVLVLTVAVGTYLATVLPDGDIGHWGGWVLVIIALIVLVAYFVKPLLGWLTTQYVFTDRRIITRTGIVARSGRDMALSKVNDVSFDYNVLERILNCGTLKVSSASDDDLVIRNLPHVEEIQREIYRLREQDDERRDGVRGPGRIRCVGRLSREESGCTLLRAGDGGPSRVPFVRSTVRRTPPGDRRHVERRSPTTNASSSA